MLQIGMRDGAIGMPWGATLPDIKLLILPSMMMIPIAWITMPIWVLAHIDYKANPTDSQQCTRCGYPLIGLPQQSCPECGGIAFAQPRRFRWRARPCLTMGVLALLFGIVVGESWRYLDERSFMREAVLHGPTHSRSRWWPGKGSSLIYNATWSPPFWCTD